MDKADRYRLAASTYVEPLVNSWSAWAHLISPVPASLHLQHYQLNTLASYLEDPDGHFRASHDPNLVGGPFVDVPAERAGEIRELLEDMKSRFDAHVEFAKALTEFQNRLVSEAQGQSLEPYYESLPEPLRGYVELVYDYYHRPSVRFLESLLYRSKYYDASLQSLRLAPLRTDGERAFFMSTPRLPQGSQVDWNVPFADVRVDEFFALEREPATLEHIRELLGLEPSDDARLLPLLTKEPLRAAPQWREDKVRLRYFGHACVLVEWKGIAVLTDPYVGVVPLDGGVERFSYEDLPERIDYLLVTHNHQDHFALETLLRLRHRTGCLVVPRAFGILHGDISLKLMAQTLGFKNVVELDSLESIPLPGGEIIAVPFLGEHADLAHAKTGYVVRAGHEQMLFAADSDCLDRDLYEHVYRALGAIQTVFLGMECVGAPLSWSCGPLFPKKPRHDIEQTRRYHGADSASGLDILQTLGAQRVYNYAMGIEPWIEFLLGLGLAQDSTQIRESDKLLEAARALGFIAAERFDGKRELLLEDSARVNRAFVAGAGGNGNSAHEDNAHEKQSDSEDQFAF